MKTRLIIRADGGTRIGMGHVVRCLSLAEMLRENFSIFFAIQQPDEYTAALISKNASIIPLTPTEDYAKDVAFFLSHLQEDDIVVLDGYHFKTFYQQKIKEKKCKLVSIDDLHAWQQLADVVINHAHQLNPLQYDTAPYTTLCLGLDYALLRKDFLVDSSASRKITALKKIFISMGASDIGNITEKMLHAVLAGEHEEIHIMAGSSNPHLTALEQLVKQAKSTRIYIHCNISAKALRTLLIQCDVSICPASSISLESCAVGIVLITGYTAVNQLEILEGLVQKGAAISLGDFNSLSIETIQLKLQQIAAHPEMFQQLLNSQRKLIDGKSPQRLLKVFNELASEQLHFRFAKEEDMDLYFDWSNDETVRENSFNQNKIEYAAHVNWFRSKLTSKSCYLYLFLNKEEKPVGQVRIDRQKSETVIGVSIDKPFRRKSYGPEMIRKATNSYLNLHPAETIIAYIKIENTPSFVIFKKAGFEREESIVKDNHTCYKLYKSFHTHEYS